MAGRDKQPGARRSRRSDGTDLSTEEVIVEAAIAAMFENGYHGTSVRQIADRAGMSVANVYYYFPSKHDLLFRFMEGSAVGLLAQLEAMVAATEGDPTLRLGQAVRLFVERHTQRQAAAFVAATELRALDPAARAAVVARRNEIEAHFRSIVQQGISDGSFAVADVGLAVRAILDMASSVSAWYREDGPMSGEQIADRYVELALSAVGAGRGAERPSPARRAPRKRRAPATPRTR